MFSSLVEGAVDVIRDHPFIFIGCILVAVVFFEAQR